MKNYFFILAVFLLSIFPVFSQNDRTFYQVCYSKDAQTYVDFSRDELVVKTLSDDSLMFEANGTPYTAKKVDGFNFYEGGKDVYQFYAYKVDNNSFFIISMGGFTYFHTDKKKLDEDDVNKRCDIEDLKRFAALKKSFEAKIDAEDKAKQNDFDSQTKGVVTDYVKNFKSKRVDPALEKGILAWWRGAPDATVINPILHIYFLNPDYEYVRNEYGILLHKMLSTMYVFKMKDSGKCFVNWRSFGYESIGGGAFENETKAWIKKEAIGFDYYPLFLRLPGDRKLYAGRDYEVDCSAF